MRDKLPNPHDLFFKGAFTRIEIVTGFIEHYLPKEITAHIDLSTVAVDLENYVSREFKEYFSDVVAQMQFLDGTLGEVYFLFEHKKGPEKLARLRRTSTKAICPSLSRSLSIMGGESCGTAWNL